MLAPSVATIVLYGLSFYLFSLVLNFDVSQGYLCHMVRCGHRRHLNHFGAGFGDHLEP